MPEIDGAVVDEMVDDALSELFREVHAMRREQALRRVVDQAPVVVREVTPIPVVANTPTLVDRNLSVKIPNVYKRWRPVEPPSRENHMPEMGLPQGVERDDTVKVIFRSGNQAKNVARNWFWGDDGGSSVIVAYRVIKLPDAPHGHWINWGRAHDRGENLDTIEGVPLGLNRQARVQVWLRDYNEPQNDIRRAFEWDWCINDESGGDIMRYRILSSSD